MNGSALCVRLILGGVPFLLDGDDGLLLDFTFSFRKTMYRINPSESDKFLAAGFLSTSSGFVFNVASLLLISQHLTDVVLNPLSSEFNLLHTSSNLHLISSKQAEIKFSMIQQPGSVCVCMSGTALTVVHQSLITRGRSKSVS